MSARPTLDDARRVTREVFGHEDLHPGQRDAIEGLLAGDDVLLVSATGSGKSLVYQVPGVLLDGITVLVSPLLALQQDQLDALPEDRRTLGARLSSAETEAQLREALERAVRGDLEFLAVSPEQLANDEVRARLAELRPSLVAVDEAHCVSSWGHDFRPDYLRLGELLADLGDPQVVALTATASAPVREDVVERLRLRHPRVVVAGFGRDNLALDVCRCTDAADQRDRLIAEVLARQEDGGGSGIVYCRTRRSAEEYAEQLADRGVRTATYHAGLSARRRSAAHEAFQAGDVDVVVATSAFGMGIDKPDVRYVLHAQVPESPDTYYQEVGRAGRDGLPAVGVLFFRPEDLSLGRFFSGGVPRRGDVRAVLQEIAHDPGATRADVAVRTGLGPRRVGRVLNLHHNVLAALVDQPGDQPAETAGVERLVEAILERAEAQRRLERSRVEMMRAYAETHRCRMEFLLAYFGERVEEPCGRCDHCVAGTVRNPTASGAEGGAQGGAQRTAYDVGVEVVHPQFGIGSVVDLDGDAVTVLFEDVGYRTLDLGIVTSKGLLETA